jgi:uncharacterized repeat protein (TIGR01451 family)
MPIAVWASDSTDPLALDKDASVVEALPGELYSYAVTVANTSPVTQTFLVTDAIPAGTTYVPGSATGGLVYDEANDRLTGSASLAGVSVAVTPSPSPFGYLAPGGAQLGAVNNICLLTTTCDDVTLTLSGVDFTYLGVRYTSIRINSNGFVAGPAVSGSTAVNQLLPDPAAPNAVIAGFWMDFDMDGTAADTGGGYYYWDVYANPADANDTYVVAGWENAQLYGNPGQSYTLQIWVRQRTDEIWFVYQNFNGGLPTGPTGGLTVGAESVSGTAGSSYFYRALGSNGAGDQGAAPVVGADLKVSAVLDSATYTYQVTNVLVGGGLIQNVVEAGQSGGPLYQAVSDVQAIAATYGAALSADMAEAGLVGSTVVYQMTVTNNGDTADSFTLDVDTVWPAVLSTASTGSLDPAESMDFQVQVTIPATADDGDSDVATVTATSEGDASVSDSATLTTTAAWYTLSLPVIRQDS